MHLHVTVSRHAELLSEPNAYIAYLVLISVSDTHIISPAFISNNGLRGLSIGGKMVSTWQTKLGQFLALRFCPEFKGACGVVNPDESGERIIKGWIKFTSKNELACDGAA